MSIDTVSRHEVQVFLAVGQSWTTSHEVAEKARVASVTARHHLLKLADRGLIERLEVFPGYRYRTVQNGQPRKQAYLQRLEDAAAAFGLTS
jgi:predicted ArsR family transcriptional regulator